MILVLFLGVEGIRSLANCSIFGAALLKTGIFVNLDNSLMCSGELEHIPDKALGDKLKFSFSILKPPIAPKASLAQKISL